MIEDSEAEFIRREIINYVATQVSPRISIVNAVNHMDFAASLEEGSPQELIIHAWVFCTADGWKNTPPLLTRLIGLVPDILDTTGRLGLAKLKLLSPPPSPSPGLDPLDSTLLANDVPFLDRTELRAKIAQFAKPASATRPILMINGKEKSGKSYSLNYIHHFSTQLLASNQSLNIYRLTFDPDIGLETGPKELAVDLVSMMGRTLANAPENNTNLKLYVRQLARWVLNEAMQCPPHHWFVLDNFGGDRLRADTKDFLVALSDLVTNGMFPQSCRLVLIGFERGLLTVNPGLVDEEIISPPSDSDIEAGFKELINRFGLALSASNLRELLLKNAPNGQSKMIELNTAVRAFLFAHAQVKDIVGSLNGVNLEEVLVKLLDSLPYGPARFPEIQNRVEALRTSAANLQ